MNKAFTKEDDDAPEPVLARPLTSLPPGVKNYMTPDGAQRLRAELERLANDERPKITALADVVESRQQMQALEQRVAHLQHSLQSAEIVQPPDEPLREVRFGASVTVRNDHGVETCYRLVGVDETDVARGWVSWRSPVAAALLGARVGQKVRLRLPGMDDLLVIVGIAYQQAAPS